jgi:hypothetical protein
MIGRGLLVGVGSALAAVIALTLAVAGLAAISHYLDPPEETAERLPDPRGHA